MSKIDALCEAVKKLVDDPNQLLRQTPVGPVGHYDGLYMELVGCKNEFDECVDHLNAVMAMCAREIDIPDFPAYDHAAAFIAKLKDNQS